MVDFGIARLGQRAEGMMRQTPLLLLFVVGCWVVFLVALVAGSNFVRDDNCYKFSQSPRRIVAIIIIMIE